MTTTIQYVDMKTSESMSLYTKNKLEKLFKKYDEIIKADVFFKHENHITNKGKICDIQLSLPGPKIYATSNEKNYEMAVKETISDLKRQLERRKTKLTNHKL